MKIVVAYKWAPNPQDAEVRPDGTVDWSRAKGAVSEHDPVAFEVARRLADATGGEVVALSVGPASSDTPLARKAALSRGPERLALVADDALAGAGSTATAAVLAAAVRAIGDVDVVVTGPESVDNGDRQVPMTLAGHLGWPGIGNVGDVQAADGGLVVERATDRGVQVLDVTGPAVLAVAADAVVPRVPGMKDILGAAKKPTDVLALADLDVPAPGAVTEVVGSSRPAPSARGRNVITTADPAAAAAELVDALRAAGAL
ncbi:electron transfer flavoprotein subunit beta/FixA family protein [Cellulomonas sp. P4]|uniref:electron transfer flavoprotein subunit beta/FixA family protein n=1 Tax=Cellulomonas sp. P4 TaxID=3142533 RepID=UPI0031BB84C9